MSISIIVYKIIKKFLQLFTTFNDPYPGVDYKYSVSNLMSLCVKKVNKAYKWQRPPAPLRANWFVTL